MKDKRLAIRMLLGELNKDYFLYERDAESWALYLWTRRN